MATTITTKYGTKINVDGLTPEQIAKVRSIAEDNGAYGAKGAALAAQFQKTNAQGAAAPTAPDTSGAYSTAGKDEAALKAERERTIAEIQKRGGKDAAPNYAARLEQIDGALRTIRAAPVAPAGPAAPADPSPYGNVGDPTKADPVNPTGGPVSNSPTPPPGAALVPAPLPEGPPKPDFTPTPVPGEKLGIDTETGVIDPNKAVPTITGAVADDTKRNFEMNNPQWQRDSLGNLQEIVTDPITGVTSIKQTAGASLTAANNAFTNAALGWANSGDNAKAAADANYNYLTRNYSQDKQREMEETKQELANRGIPLNFAGDPNNPDNLYSRATGSIDRKFQGLYDQANNQALMARDASLSTQVGVIGSLGSTVAQQSPGFTAFQGGQSNQGEALLNILGTISDADMAKYGIDKDFAAKLKAIAASKSGGSSGSSDGGVIIGGNAPGFGV